MAEVIIFGAGKTGRGFIGYLCHSSGYTLTFVDKNEELVRQLNEEKQYKINILGDPAKNITLSNYHAFVSDDKRWMSHFCNASMAFVSVVGTNFPSLAPLLCKAIEKRYHLYPEQPFNIITCENYTSAAAYLRRLITGLCPNTSLQKWIHSHVGIVEAMVLCTSLDPSGDDHPLTINNQPFYELPCDAEAFRGDPPPLTGLKPLRNFSHQLERKIYTYNCINAIISYMGACKGYQWLWEAAEDKEILQVAHQAGQEISQALIAEYGFDPTEQAQWIQAAISKFSNRNIPDPIERNAADVRRKLSRNDRLTGPALLCLKHHITPSAIIKGMIAAFSYNDKGFSVLRYIEKEGVEKVIHEICGLDPGEPLFNLIVSSFHHSRTL